MESMIEIRDVSMRFRMANDRINSIKEFKKTEQVFIFASVPFFDVGGGQRSAQLARIFNAMGKTVHYIYGFHCSEKDAPDMVYITNDDRVDILAKPLANGDVALLFQNLSQEKKEGDFSITKEEIIKSIGENMVDVDKMRNAASFAVKDLWTGEEKVVDGGKFVVSELEACDNVTLRISVK